MSEGLTILTGARRFLPVLRETVRGTAEPHKLKTAGATPAPATNFLRAVRAERLARRLAVVTANFHQVDWSTFTPVHAAKPKDLNVSVKAIVRNSRGEVLLLDDAGSGYWDLPGGHVEPGEKPEDALRREVREETGLELGGLKPLPGDVLDLGGTRTPVLFYEATVADGGMVEASSEPGHPFYGNQWTKGLIGEGHIKLRDSSVTGETEKAIKVRLQTDEGMVEHWLPKSHASVDEHGAVHATPWIISQKELQMAESERHDIEHAAPKILTGDSPPPETAEQKSARDKATEEAWRQIGERKQKAQVRRFAAADKRAAEQPAKEVARRAMQADNIENIHLPSAHKELERVKALPNASKAVARVEKQIADYRAQLSQLRGASV